jgi:site-specific recombinase XerD
LLSSPAKRAVTGKPIKYFTREEIRVLLAIPDVAKKTGRRDKVLMSALYATGARASEICELTVGSIIFASPPGLTRVRLHGKGDKWRTVTVASNCSDLLKRHLDLEGLGAPGTQARHVFSTQSHEWMSVVCVEEIVKKHVTAAKKLYPGMFREGSYSPHSFRHSAAMHKLEAGDSLIELKAFLGHEKMETTLEYAKVTPALAAKFLLERDIPDDASGMENKKDLILDAMPFLENRRLKK